MSFLSVAIQAALAAGDILRRGFGTKFQISSKEGKQNLVTEYDHAAEKAIISFIRNRFPDHSFLAEESGLEKQSSSVCWVIDPLDGTVNFAHHIPVFSVSIAVCSGEEMLAGVVYQPMTQELFVAEKGNGAYLNGNRLYVSKTEKLTEAFLVTGFPYNVDENPLHCIDTFSHLTKLGIPIRRLGSAALDLSYVAAGRFDAYWEVSLSPWDFAAGALLVEEAGGKVSHYRGTPLSLDSKDRTILGSNGILHSSMMKQLL